MQKENIMRPTIALIATAAAALVGTAPASAATPRAFDAITGIHRPATNDYCIHSGWGTAGQAVNRLIRKGECRTAADWRRRGLVFEAGATSRTGNRTPTMVAAR